MQASDVKAITGRGVQAQVGGETVHIGKPVLFSELPGFQAFPPTSTRPMTSWSRSGRTTMVVRKGSRFLGVIGVMDTPRPVAAAR